MILFMAIAALVVVLDYITKWVVVRELPFSQDVHILGDWVMLTHIKNTGAAFGLFPGSIMPLIVISVGASVVVFILALRAGNRFARILPLGLILGGAIGNLIDRIGQGRVTDFVNIGIPGGPRWPVFNVADSAVTIGVAILAFGVYFKSGSDHRHVETSDDRDDHNADTIFDRHIETTPGRLPEAVPPQSTVLEEPTVPEPRTNAIPGEPG